MGVDIFTDKRLQWGRRENTAEICGPSQQATKGNRLQWGRRENTAEIGLRERAALRAVPARFARGAHGWRTSGPRRRCNSAAGRQVDGDFQ